MQRTSLQDWARAASLTAALALGACASTASQATEQTPATAPVEARATFVDTRGTAHDVDASLKAGRQVAFVFWQPWCESCKAESPLATSATQEFSASMDVIGVVSGPEGSVDEKAMQEAFFSWGMSYPSVRDKDLTLSKAFNVVGVPTIVIINPDGSIAYRSHAAPAEWGGE